MDNSFKRNMAGRRKYFCADCGHIQFEYPRRMNNLRKTGRIHCKSCGSGARQRRCHSYHF